jgi:phage-related protein (TIGR01555 family)
MGYVFDTFTNFLSGLGVTGRDKMTAHRYTRQLWSRDQLEASFQSDWIARKAITIPPQDSTRQWRAWQAEADQIEKLEATENRLRVQLKLQEALVKARLYGGCCIMLGVDGNMEMELKPESIKKDGLKFLHVLAPHQLAVQNLIKDVTSPYYGQPEFYGLNDETGKLGNVRIHPSRMVRLVGLDPPDPMANYGWGDPVLQMINDAVASAGTVQQSIASMISEAKFDVVKIPGLTEIFSTTEGTSRLVKRFSEANVAKSVINAVVLDGEEEWQRIGVDFTGMPEIMQMYMHIAAGAADIPATRFLGQAPSGLNATGESDLTNYYDRIKSDQELRLSPALEKLDIAIQMSALGKFDENIFYEWNPLWQLSETEKATIAKTKADTAAVDASTGLIPFEALVKGRVNQLIEDGTYPGLEAALEDAIANQEMLSEEELLQMQSLSGQPPPKLLAGPRNMEGGGDDVDTPRGRKQKEVAKDSSAPFARAAALDRLATALRDLLVPWDESLHPRGGVENPGQFTAKGASMSTSVTFVSPSVKSNLDLKGAQRELNSRQQLRMRLSSKDIYDKLGVGGVQQVDALGVWSDGAENTLVARANGDWEHNKLAAVMKGYIYDQKAVIVFQQDDANGKQVLAQFDATGSIASISKKLQKGGIEFYTLVPKADGATVYMVDFDGTQLDKMHEAAGKYGDDNPLHIQFGRAEQIGYDGKGTDRQQRDRARDIYQSAIDASPIEEARSVWQDVRDHWLPPYEAEGYELTPTAILAEHPDIKPNSVLVTDAAKMLNDRAGEILQRDLGMRSITEENHTPETDEYLAQVIAIELREGLIGGASGEHWYDNTVKEAMKIAEEIYPGIAKDPDQKFIYTVALAITSQGETVERNVALADQAYTHFLEHGRFPTDIKVKKTSIVENLRKVNEAIEEGGVKKLREFFDTKMTAKELTARTGVKPGATLVSDVLYGSAMLGPKIGQGFYQNLNGNFTPITMDLWFMRAWGRITNTGVSAAGHEDQMERFVGALRDAGHPVPRTEAGRIELAAKINDEHERAFAAATKAGRQKQYEKSELILASERLTLVANGKLVEQPKNGTQRKWITSVFNRSLAILKETRGIELTPAGAQATWWWPEKILWESIGVTGKERDTDYAKSLAALKNKKRDA